MQKFSGVPVYNIFMPTQKRPPFLTFLAKGGWKTIHTLWIQVGFFPYAYFFTDWQPDGRAVFNCITLSSHKKKKKQKLIREILLNVWLKYISITLLSKQCCKRAYFLRAWGELR